MQRFLKAAVLIGLGAFLYTRLLSDVILFYINERFVTLTLLAAVGLILIGASLFIGRRGEEAGRAGDGHDHGGVPWLGLFVLAIPIVLGLLVPSRPLGAAALGNREINLGQLTSISPPRDNTEMGLLPGERNILDWLLAFQRDPNPTAFKDQEARVVGFVYRDERFAEDMFMVGRYVLSCCVADASPVGLIVRWPEAPSLAEDQWVEVSGRFEAGTFDGRGVPILLPESINLIDAPSQPYLYQ